MSAFIDPQSREEKDTVFAVLSSHRRRYLLYALQHLGGAATLGDLADQVAAWEYEKPVEAVTPTERKRIYTSLQQHHIDTLEDAGLIVVDHDRITTTERGERIRRHLGENNEQSIPWPLYYLLLSILGGTSLLLVVMGWFPDSSALIIAGLLTMVLFISAVMHVIDHQSRPAGARTEPPDA